MQQEVGPRLHVYLNSRVHVRAGMRPPPAKKQAMVVREAPPVCLRNIFASDDPREDDKHNALMHSLPRSAGHGQSRFECELCSAIPPEQHILLGWLCMTMTMLSHQVHAKSTAT